MTETVRTRLDEPTQLAAQRAAAYFAGTLSEEEAEAFRERMANDPDLADVLLDLKDFEAPPTDTVSPHTLTAWKSQDRRRLENEIHRLRFFQLARYAAGIAALAASIAGVFVVTAPVTEASFVPASTLRGPEDLTSVALPRWPHRIRFKIKVVTLKEIHEPFVELYDSMTEVLADSTQPRRCNGDLCAEFWGLAPGNYQLKLLDRSTDPPEAVGEHPIEILAEGPAP